MLSRVAATLVLSLCLCSAPGESPPQAGPVEAEFLTSVNARSLAIGSTLYARVTRDWHGPGCFLPQDSILKATVELAESRSGLGTSKLALAFTGAQCGGLDFGPLALRLAAIAELPQNWETLPSALFQLTLPIPAWRPNSSALLSKHTGAGHSTARLELQAFLHHFPASAEVRPGSVIGLPGLKLNVATGPDRNPVLSVRGRQLALEAYTQLLLVPSPLLFASAPVPPPSAHHPAQWITLSQTAPRPPSPPPADTLDACEARGCVHDVRMNNPNLQGQNAASIAIRPLGYLPRTSRYLGNFADDDALAWLGPRQLLFAFNAHRLIPRAPIPNWRAAHRMIRAVLLDPQHRVVIRAIDWEVMDSNRYLWPLPGNRVLVHVGNELRIYSAGLRVEETVRLAAPLAFLRVAPDGEFVTVATLQERHSPALHLALRDLLSEEPGENLFIEVLDRNLRVLAQASTASQVEPPSLLNEGQLVLHPLSASHYQVALNTWDGKRTTLGRFVSGCAPELSSTAPDLIFLLTCTGYADSVEYRVLRADGRLLIHSAAMAREIGQEISGDSSSGMFVIKTVHTLRPLGGGMYFRGDDLESAELRVYRASDGKQLRAFRVNKPSTSRGGYALSPDSTRLAVLSEEGIQLFPVTEPAR